jgi:hypothetical protein
MTRILLIAFLLEIGFMLIVLPWSTYWDHNYFVAMIPAARPFFVNNFVRGAISGLGLLNMTVAIIDLLSPMFVRPGSQRPSVGITPSAAAKE